MNLKGKIAVVTGASYGIGRAAAEALSASGAVVVLAARSEKILKSLSAKLPDSYPIQTDMTDISQIRRMVKKTVEKFGGIDILVNNAGRGYDASIIQIDIQVFRQIIDLDLIGPLVAMQCVIPIMKKNGGGSIINIASGTALMHLQEMGAYSSVKRALVGLSLTAADELAEHHINVSVVYPYITATDFEKNTVKAEKRDDVWDPSVAGDLPPADPPEFVAQKIMEAIHTGTPEIFAHDWMGKRR